MPTGFEPLDVDRPPGTSASLGDLFKDLYPVPPEESESAYYEAFGRFIAAYALAESAVHEVARNLTGLSEEKARVLFAGMRLSDLEDRIRAMLRTDKAEADRVTEIDASLVHLDVIQDARNKLVHRSVNYSMGKFVVTNVHVAKTRESAQFDVFTRANLQDMKLDCNRIFLRLMEAIAPMEQDLGEPPQGFASWSDYLRQPWRYKPAPPAPPTKQSPKALGEPQRQPRASRASRRKAALEQRKD